MPQNILMHPHSHASRITLRVIRTGQVHTILDIKTKLSLDPNDLQYDHDALESLTLAAADYLISNPEIDHADVEQI